MAKSNEATKDQLAFAKAEGDSVDKCINWLLQQKGIINGQTNVGEYKITFIRCIFIMSTAKSFFYYAVHN